MDLILKHFRELTLDELADIYRLRVSVFVVEQNCPYQEIDAADKTAYHLYLKDEDGIQAYARSLYEKAGFIQISDEFLEDGIPHILMQFSY